MTADPMGAASVASSTSPRLLPSAWDYWGKAQHVCKSWWSRTRLKCPTSVLLLSHPLTFASDCAVGYGVRRSYGSHTTRRRVTSVFSCHNPDPWGETGHLAKVSV